LLSIFNYFFFFFAAFLAFLFFAITGLHQGLRKQSTKAVRTATAYSIAGASPDGSNPFASRHAKRAAWKKKFPVQLREVQKTFQEDYT
jgi:hypothetical protein